MEYKDSSHNEIEIILSFKYSCFLKTNGYKEDYHIRKPNNENLLLEIEDKNMFEREKK